MTRQLSLLTMLLFSIALNFSMKAQTSPILDRDLFFGNPEISGGQLSPDGKFISFMKSYEGIMNVWVKTFDEPFEAARPLTNSKRPLYGYFWTEDGKYILYVKDKDGDENINVFAVDPRADGPGIPESRNLTPLDEVTAQIYNVSENDPDMLMIGLNDRDKAWHDLYSLRISTGELVKIYENNDRITAYNFDWDDTLRLLYRTDEKGNTTILRKEGDTLEPIYETSVTESAYVAGWNETNGQFYIVTNKGELDLSTAYLMNPVTKKMTLVESDPEKRVDFGGISLDRNTRKVLYTTYTDDRTRIYWKDKKWEENYKFLQQRFEGREVGFQSSTSDYSKMLISVYGDRYASESWFFDVEKRELIHQYTPRPELKKVEEHLAPMKPVRYKSSDGLEISGYLTLPAGMEAKNLPMVVLVHGGPKGPRDNWGFNSIAQFLANRGYAVLQPNFRASGGYGKKFLNAGDLQWGKLMQDDITWGVNHMIKQGVADKNRVAIMGGSYGGYATLAGLAFTPELYACGVDIVGPSNIFTLLESVPAYWESARAYLYGMVGDPNTEEGKKLIRQASPLFSADKINKPLLIVQGANDPRVKKAEADQIVVALRDRGHDVSYLLAEDEGHGFAKPVNNMAMYAEIERFLSEKIGGRYQKEMPEDVARRLGEIRMDISKVVYNPAANLKTAASFPEIKTRFVEGSAEFDVSISLPGQEITMITKRTVAKNDGNWVITDASEGAMGSMSDAMVYGADLKPISRTISQSGQEIDVKYHSDKLAVKAMGQAMEIPYEGALLSPAAGFEQIVSGLPLKEGYELVVMMDDMATMKAKQYKMHVAGTESLNGKDYWKVDLVATENESEKTMLWINKETNMTDRIEQVAPAMGNAIIVTTRKG